MPRPFSPIQPCNYCTPSRMARYSPEYSRLVYQLHLPCLSTFLLTRVWQLPLPPGSPVVVETGEGLCARFCFPFRFSFFIPWLIFFFFSLLLDSEYAVGFDRSRTFPLRIVLPEGSQFVSCFVVIFSLLHIFWGFADWVGGRLCGSFGCRCFLFFRPAFLFIFVSGEWAAIDILAVSISLFFI